MKKVCILLLLVTANQALSNKLTFCCTSVAAMSAFVVTYYAVKEEWLKQELIANELPKYDYDKRRIINNNSQEKLNQKIKNTESKAAVSTVLFLASLSGIIYSRLT